jgi:hypothetical protein
MYYVTLPASAARAASERRAERPCAMSARHVAHHAPRHRRDIRDTASSPSLPATCRTNIHLSQITITYILFT